jgi:hypothetical protein
MAHSDGFRPTKPSQAADKNNFHKQNTIQKQQNHSSDPAGDCGMQ